MGPDTNFNRVAPGKGCLITMTVSQSIDERVPGNVRGFRALQTTTVNNLHTAIRHLRGFLQDDPVIACLEHVTPALALKFIIDHLPSQTSNRGSPDKSYKVAAKNVLHLKDR